MSQDVLIEKADAISSLICDSELVHQYWRAKDKMAQHEHAQQLFEALKLKTNNHIGLAHVLPADHPKMKQMEEQIHNLEEELHGIPVAMQFKQAHADLNDLMQGIMKLLISRLGEVVPVEFGPRVGCGKGPDGNGCNCGGEGGHHC